MVLGSVEEHAAPAAADVEQAHPRLEPELPADQLVLVGLRLLERARGVGPHRARVRHGGAEHAAVEVVRDVVVVRDGGGVALLRMAPAVESRLLGRLRHRLERARPDEPEGCHPLRGSELHVRQVVAQRERSEDVALQVEVAGDVGPPEAELARRLHDAAQRGGGTDLQRGRRVRGPQPAAVVRLDRDRQVGPEELLEERCELRCHARQCCPGRVKSRPR